MGRAGEHRKAFLGSGDFVVVVVRVSSCGCTCSVGFASEGFREEGPRVDMAEP